MSEPDSNLYPEQKDAGPEDLTIRAAPRRVSGLRRRTIRMAIALLAVIVAAALMFGLGISFRGHGAAESHKIEPPPPNMQPSPIADLPSSYADLPPRKPVVSPAGAQTRQDARTSSAENQQLSRLLESIQQVGQKNQELAQKIASYQAQVVQEQAKVWASGLFFKMDQTPDRQQGHASGSGANAADSLAALKNMLPQTTGTSPPSPVQQQLPTDQQRKLAFLNQSPAPQMDIERTSFSSAPSESDSTGYLLQAGTVVPAALLTGINTDLPGDIVASVTQGVYDSPTGNHLLIPQGARLYGSYDSQIAPSQDRALLVWHRLLLPSGQSLNLDRMRGTDAAGYAGLADKVDYHIDKLATAAVISGVLAYAGNLAGGRQTLTLTPGDVVGDAIAQQASTTGSNIVQRQLNVQPTITIRPGWPVRVLVNRDILLPPYTN